MSLMYDSNLESHFSGPTVYQHTIYVTILTYMDITNKAVKICIYIRIHYLGVYSYLRGRIVLIYSYVYLLLIIDTMLLQSIYTKIIFPEVLYENSIWSPFFQC